MIMSLNEQATASEGVLADDQSLVAYNNDIIIIIYYSCMFAKSVVHSHSVGGASTLHSVSIFFAIRVTKMFVNENGLSRDHCLNRSDTTKRRENSRAVYYIDRRKL